MKRIFSKLIKKLTSSQKKKPAFLYRLPDITWMTDVKKASECGAMLVKKPNIKKPNFS